MTTFSKWQHPKTGEVRVYVNGLPGTGFGVKVFLKRGAQRVSDSNHDWEDVVFAERGCLNRSRDDLRNAIDFALKEVSGSDEYINTFERVLELAK